MQVVDQVAQPNMIPSNFDSFVCIKAFIHSFECPFSQNLISLSKEIGWIFSHKVA